jgi:uncharacterized protein DUF87
VTRQELEEAVLATASSIDGRTLTFQRSLHGLDLQPGGYVSIAGRFLGQVHSLEHAWAEGGELAAATGLEGSHFADGRAALVRGNGVVLGDGAQPFHELPFERASAAALSALLTEPGSSARLDVGELLLEPEVRFSLDAGGFNRHTFLCGQSGSGKTYALGVLLEQILLRTSIRVVVLDPNSDFVRLRDVRDGTERGLAAQYRKTAAELVVRSNDSSVGERLHVRFRDCDAEEQAGVLRLDPIRDRREYGALLDVLDTDLESTSRSTAELAEQLRSAPREDVQILGARLRNLGIDGWPIWSVGDSGSVQDLVAPGGPRALVVDLGSLATPGEKAIAAESVLAALWRHRAGREPVLLVIDEAHNVCPREPADEVTALASEAAGRIAAEGRKFGIYLLVSTQRPQRVNELVVSQCDNLLLMRMTSTGDLAYVSEVLSFAPRPLLDRATSFRIGESLVAGKIASHAALVRFGPRISEEGGADVPATWARRA